MQMSSANDKDMWFGAAIAMPTAEEAKILNHTPFLGFYYLKVNHLRLGFRVVVTQSRLKKHVI